MFDPDELVILAFTLVKEIRKHNLDRKEHAQVFVRRFESLSTLLGRLGGLRDHAIGNMSILSRAWVMGTERRAWGVLHGLAEIIAPLMTGGLGRFNLVKAIFEGSGSRKIQSAIRILDEQIDKVKECVEDLQHLGWVSNDAKVDTSTLAVRYTDISSISRPQRLQQSQINIPEDIASMTSASSEELGGTLVEALGEALDECTGEEIGG